MSFAATDVNFVLSGGVNNNDPKFSLGGFPSPTPMPDTLNNLFTDINPSQASDGKTDYRCFYVFNDSGHSTMYECTLFTKPTVLDASTPTTVLIGMLFRNEVQTISFIPLPNSLPTLPGGSFTLEIDSTQTSSISYSANNTTLAANMETALKAILENDITVAFAGFVGDTKNFTITFHGVNKNKAFSVIENSKDLDRDGNNIHNTIVPPHEIEVAKTIIGSPINTVAPDIGDERTAPTGITFTLPGTNGLSVGSLRAAEGFPVWVQRNVPFLAESLDNDGIRVKIRVKTSPGI